MVNLRDDALFDYPWLYAVEVGDWYLDDYEAARLREYLLRGGFLMVDDFHGSRGWYGFNQSLQKVFPDRPWIEIPESDEVMHVLYDLDKSTQIPGVRALYSGRTWEDDGYDPHWRGIYDDKGRLLVAINFNMDLGRCLGTRRYTRLPGTHDGDGVPIRGQLRHLRDDALSGRNVRVERRLARGRMDAPQAPIPMPMPMPMPMPPCGRLLNSSSETLPLPSASQAVMRASAATKPF